VIRTIKFQMVCSGLLATAALIGTGAKAIAQGKSADPTWLTGYWEGHFDDPSKDKGAIFEIRVKSVGNDGIFAAEWDRYGASEDVGKGTVAGHLVTLSFRNGNVTTLRRNEADTLVGSTALAKGGRSNEFIFVKRSSDANAPVTSDHGCSFSTTATTSGHHAMEAKEDWHLTEGEKTKYFGQLWQNGTLLGDGRFLCHNGHLAKAE
jgi:hypothetical protein